MPRIPRNLTLIPGLQTHKTWRGHNREWNLQSQSEKQHYISYINDELKSSTNQLHAVVLMSNHSHEVYTIGEVAIFSNEMRRAHSRYGMFFNRAHKRCGQVAQDRAKTCTIESDDYAMRATFYIHANPVRANIVKQAGQYEWSTHNLFAYGKRRPWMSHIVFPEWYMALGKNMLARQKRYRQLFDAYLQEMGLVKLNFHQKPFFGSQGWQLPLIRKINDWRQSIPPP